VPEILIISEFPCYSRFQTLQISDYLKKIDVIHSLSFFHFSIVLGKSLESLLLAMLPNSG